MIYWDIGMVSAEELHLGVILQHSSVLWCRNSRTIAAKMLGINVFAFHTRGGFKAVLNT